MTEITTPTVRRRTGNVNAPPPARSTPTQTTGIFNRIGAPSRIEYIKGVLFGPPKSGKTKAACTGGKTLLVEMEPDGDATLNLHPELTVDVIRPTKASEMEEIVVGLATTERGRWDTVVWDSVTYMLETVGGKDLYLATKDNKDPRRAFLKMGQAVNHVISDVTKLPMNVIFTAQLVVENTTDDETPANPEEGEYPVTLAITPMVYKLLVPAVSFIGRTYKKVGIDRNTNPPRRVGEHWVSFEDFGRSPAGNRLGLPEQVKDLNLTELLATIQGGS